ncbi:MAG: hypothetical protein HYT76_04535 [Deltaproteobacteria bacterium]|nr:hypothetical protein [Deltaproteobacteria bacterium]
MTTASYLTQPVDLFRELLAVFQRVDDVMLYAADEAVIPDSSPWGAVAPSVSRTCEQEMGRVQRLWDSLDAGEGMVRFPQEDFHVGIDQAELDRRLAVREVTRGSVVQPIDWKKGGRKGGPLEIAPPMSSLERAKAMLATTYQKLQRLQKEADAPIGTTIGAMRNRSSHRAFWGNGLSALQAQVRETSWRATFGQLSLVFGVLSSIALVVGLFEVLSSDPA